jgi:hypothetical protein
MRRNTDVLLGTVLGLCACASDPALVPGSDSNAASSIDKAASDAAAPEASTSSGAPQSSSSVAPVVQGGCNTVRKEALGQVNTRSNAQVIILEQDAQETLLYVDASAGGFQNSAANPYVYLRLNDHQKLTITDLEADSSSDWDLAFKRFTIRTNSADSGPGRGGAIALAASFEDVVLNRVDTTELLTDDFVDDATCDIAPGDQGVGGVWTPFSGWYDYHEADMTLWPTDAIYVVRSANADAYFKLQILDYYATPEGKQGQVSARFLLRYAKL